MRKYIPVFVILLIAALVGGTYYMNDRLSQLREQKESLSSQIAVLQSDTDSLLARKQVYTEAFAELERLRVGDGEAGTGLDFYSEAQRAIRRGGSRIISNSPQAPAGGVIKMGMSFTGDYYSALRSLAELRALRNAVRVVSLQLSPVQPVGDVQLNITLEAPN